MPGRTGRATACRGDKEGGLPDSDDSVKTHRNWQCDPRIKDVFEE